MAYGMDDRASGLTVGWARIGTGLTQGLALWALTEIIDGKAGLSANPVLLGALEAVAVFAPFVVLAGLADMRRRTLVLWGVAAAVVLAALGAHDIGRRVAQTGAQWLAPETLAFLAAALFIAHHLVAGADADRKPIARFATYFDLAWKHGVQLAMSAGFVGVFWIVLFLGGALFKLIGITLIADVIDKPWFAFPATGTMFAAAVQLTDVRHGLIRGIRTVALTLLSWLLPVLVVLVGAFMASLPFTGLEPLWKTKSAAAILLSAAAIMVILINAAYQDGEPDEPTPLVLRWAARAGGLLLVPLVAVAAYAVWLRVGQYGLTPDRIIATACVIAGVCYAIGYSVAALLPGPWMKPLELTNIVTAFVVVGLILALFSPLADPARLSVDDQMARIAAGRLAPDKVDYRFLRFESERYGLAALKTLKAKGGEIGKRAGEALAASDRSRLAGPPAAEAAALQIQVAPKGKILPPGFVAIRGAERDGGLSSCLDRSKPCQALLLDLNDDGVDEVVLNVGYALIVSSADGSGAWRQVGQFSPVCPDLDASLRDGKVQAAPSRWRDLVIDGRVIGLNRDDEGCVAKEAAPRAP
jgi:hypothetical protein